MRNLRIAYVLSCALLLGDGLSRPALANNPNLGGEETSANPCESRGGQTVLGAEQDPGKGGYTIRGEVLRVEGDTAIVRKQDDKEVRLQTDQHDIAHGDHIQANMNEENQALRIGSLKSTDRRNEHEVDCR